MNNIALNQNILNKGLIIGASPQQGISETPIITAEGVQVFLNGTHVMPEHEDLDNGMEIWKYDTPICYVRDAWF